MNTRILDLIQDPKLLTKEDLPLLRNEIDNTPYMQSLRALELVGTYHFDKENYTSVLSETAAFTTDKKILYQLIFGKTNKAKTIISKEDYTKKTTLPEQKETETEELPNKTPGLIVGEIESCQENFDEIIRSENTIERKNIGTAEDIPEKSSAEIAEENPVKEETSSDAFVPKIVLNKKNETNEEKSEEDSEISFHTTNAFFPNVKFNIPRPAEYKKTLEENTPQELVTPINTKEQKTMEAENISQPETKEQSYWQPMTIEVRTPDALIGKNNDTNKSVETTSEKPKESIKPIEKKLYQESQQQEEKQIETSIKSLSIESEKEEQKSNVSSFINTWQKWLELGSNKKNTKTDLVDKFIESNYQPKKNNKDEEVEYEFVYKDKGDDISHLMTETLANLYVEQKYYARAIASFKILQEKYPEKKKEYEKKIREIKNLRSGK